ncbi:unnamed protein product [Closterium sp. Naga37s-1]|nr:unnamed protein product [Closterium sp. Naga37s-1]
MANRARAMSINHLPDELLSRIISLATVANSAGLTAEVDAEDTGQTREPNLTDAPGGSNLAAVCKRWMLLMTTLRVRGDFDSHFSELRRPDRREMTLSAPAISAPALFRALALAPSITALILEANAVDFYDDEFLSRLLSARPQLARLSIAPPRFTGAPHFRISTKSLENFFRVASSRLQELSLRECFGHTTKLPASIASLSSLRVLRMCSKVLRSLPNEISNVSLEPLSQLISLERLELASYNHKERVPEAVFTLPSLVYVNMRYFVWLEPHDVMAVENTTGYVARNHPAAAAADADANAAASAAAAGHHSALGPLLKHLTMYLGSLGYGRRSITLSARLCSLLSLTHLSIDGLSSSIILPSDLGHLTNLRSLSLCGTWLFLPHSLSRLAPCLHSLKLHYNSGVKSLDAFQRAFPSFLTDLTSLTHLHLHNIHLPSSLPGVARLCALRTLHIEYGWHHRSHVSLPEDLGQLAALEWLELRGCSLSDGLPRTLCDLTSLRRLFIGSKALKQVPTEISQLSRLEELTLDSCNSLESLPPGFGFLRSLKNLHIRGGLRYPLPDTLGGLSSLEEVSLARCSHGFSLPPSFCLLPRLLTLTLTSCDDLTALPFTFGSLCSLQRLSVHSCKKVHHLPDSFSALLSLTFLTISKCLDFASLSETFGLLPRLTRLKIVDCDSFTHLPGSFSLSTLQVACFSHCKHLHSLPSTPSLLPRLEVIQLRECEALKCLPESLGEVRALRHVDVYGSGVSEKGVEEVGFCGKQVHVVWGRMGKAEHVGTKDKGRKGRGCAR